MKTEYIEIDWMKLANLCSIVESYAGINLQKEDFLEEAIIAKEIRNMCYKEFDKFLIIGIK